MLQIRQSQTTTDLSASDVEDRSTTHRGCWLQLVASCGGGPVSKAVSSRALFWMMGVSSINGTGFPAVTVSTAAVEGVDGDRSHRPLFVHINSILSPILYCFRQKERNSLMLSMN